MFVIFLERKQSGAPAAPVSPFLGVVGGGGGAAGSSTAAAAAAVWLVQWRCS